MFFRAIDLASNQLSNVIPTEIGVLEQLLSLDVHNNDLGNATGLPTEIGTLNLLADFNVRQNSINGLLPSGNSSM